MARVYHYSKSLYPQLKPIVLQGPMDPARKKTMDERSAKWKLPGPYYDHVSFLLEPAPVDILGSLFPADHHSWATGTKLYQYDVDVARINLYAWEIVETPADTWIFDHTSWIDTDWGNSLLSGVLKHYKLLTNSRGTDLNELLKELKTFKPGFTREAYLELAKRKDFDEIKHMYAPTVPHVMIYTKEPIPITAVKRVTVGNQHISQQQLEALLNW